MDESAGGDAEGDGYTGAVFAGFDFVGFAGDAVGTSISTGGGGVGGACSRNGGRWGGFLTVVVICLEIGIGLREGVRQRDEEEEE